MMLSNLPGLDGSLNTDSPFYMSNPGSVCNFVRGQWEAPREEVLCHVLSCDKCMLEVMEIDEILSMPDVDEDEIDEEAYYAGLVKYLNSIKMLDCLNM